MKILMNKMIIKVHVDRDDGDDYNDYDKSCDSNENDDNNKFVL